MDPAKYERIQAIRRFNRFYTQRIGVLGERYLESGFSLTEGRVLYALAHGDQATATQIGKELALDAGYLSRIVRKFVVRGLIRKTQSADDRRESLLRLTNRGQHALRPLENRANRGIQALLEGVPEAEQKRLIGAMQTISKLLGEPGRAEEAYLLRPHAPGDMGWIVHRQAVLYVQEYGFNEEFEALIARILAEFLEKFDAKRERCWIAELDREIAGSVLVVNGGEDVAKLRMLYVEPRARGMGIGSRLVSECIRFARQVRYRKLTLWTQSTLLPARRIYERAGFRLVGEQPHHSFGHDLIGETWELELE